MKEHAINIVRELRRRGFQAYLAGGCVRDTLLGVAPADYDVATDATPREVMRIFPETYAVGAQFGVVLVPGPEDVPPSPTPSEHPNYVEVATFRNDGAYSDGRHPDDVRYSKDPREDVQRRDFTINGKDKLTIAGPAFGPVLFSVWLGPKPPNANLKKGILGQ